MKVPLKRWRAKGYQVWVYLDDILLVACSKKLLQKQLQCLLVDLEDAGLTVNVKKSVLEPTQVVHHLGFILNLQEGTLQIPKEKIRKSKKELGTLIVSQSLTCKKVSSILGTVRSFLTAFPFLRAFSDQLVAFVKQSQVVGWNTPKPIPSALQQEVRDLKVFLEKWQGRAFEDSAPPKRNLHSDSSHWAWGGLDVTSGLQVQEWWRAASGSLHINLKELQAAALTVQALARAGETVHLHVDNSVAHAYIRRGGANSLI